jgi:hypothetical protein
LVALPEEFADELRLDELLPDEEDPFTSELELFSLDLAVDELLLVVDVEEFELLPEDREEEL